MEQPPVDGHGKWRKLALFSIPLAILTWTAMSACLDNGFINWDETAYLIRNPYVRSLSFENIKNIFTTSDLHLYTPLSTLSYAIEYHFAELNPRVYHATNLGLHLGSTFLVMLFVWLLLARFADAGATRLRENTRLWLAFGAAIFFGVHPAHVESVAWVAERKDMLYAFFFLLAAILYIIPERRGRHWPYVLSLVAFALSLLAKPMAVTLPPILLAFELLLEGRLVRCAVLRTVPYFIMSAAALAPILLTPGQGPQVALAQRITIPLYNIGYYAGLLLVPVNLSAMHTGVSRVAAYCSSAAVIATIILLWRFLRKDRLVLMALCLYIFPLLPVIQIIPFGQFVSADRYTYMASVGFFLLVAAPLGVWLQDSSARLRVAAGALALCVALAFATAARVRCAVWFNGVTLWQDTLLKSPRSSQALGNLCSAYINVGQQDKALSCLDRVLREQGPSADTYFNIGFIQSARGQTEAASENFRKALQLDNCHDMALLGLGSVAFKADKMAEAEYYYNQAARCGTYSAVPFRRLALIAGKRGDTATAERYNRQARKLDPSAPIP